MTHRIPARTGWFPEPSACPEGGAEIVDRWEALLAKAPRLRPWLLQMLNGRRQLLQEGVVSAATMQIERTLWLELSRWLEDFEALPQFAVSAIATTLQDAEPAARRAEPEARPQPREWAESPERAVGDLETLLSDPAFALAFHCVEVRLRPELACAWQEAPALARVPECDWFGLLRASAKAEPILTAGVAVSLVLRVLSADWARIPAEARKAALRLFRAGAADLRAHAALQRLCAALPSAWALSPVDAPQFVAAARRARVGLQSACKLCGRIVAATRGPRRGGLSSLQVGGEEPAGPDELAELAQTARKYAEMGGFRRLLSIL